MTRRYALLLCVLGTTSFSACAPTVGPLGPDESRIARRPAFPRFVDMAQCVWRGSAYSCPPGEPITIRVRRGEDAEEVMWKTCPRGYVLNRTEDVPIGSTSVSSTYKSGGANDWLGTLVGRKTNTYTQTTLVTEQHVTFTCRDRPLEPASEVVCSSGDVRSCVRVRKNAETAAP